MSILRDGLLAWATCTAGLGSALAAFDCGAACATAGAAGDGALADTADALDAGAAACEAPPVGNAASFISVLSFVDSWLMRPSTSSPLEGRRIAFVIALVSTLITRDVSVSVPLLSLMNMPVIMYCAPTILPSRTAVWASIVFSLTRFCSVSSAWM